MSVSVSVHGRWMAGVGRGVYMVCGFAEDRTLVTGPSEKSACVLRGRRVCTINYFYTPVSRLSTRASGLRAPRHARSRGPRAPPRPAAPSLLSAARSAPRRPSLLHRRLSLCSRSVTLGRSLAAYASAMRSLEHLACWASLLVLRTRYTRVYSLFKQLSTRVPSFNLEPWKHHVTNT